MSNSSRLRVLVIEDDVDTLANLCDILEIDGCDVVSALTAADAIHRSDWPSYAAILLDWRLPDANGHSLLPMLRGLAPEAAVIVSTGAGGLDDVVTALRHGAADYITKPVDADLLRASLRRVAEQKRLREEKAHSDAAFRSLVEAAASLIIITRADGRIAYINPFGESLTGYTQAEALNSTCVELLIPEAFRGNAYECLANVFRNQPARDLEMPIVDRDGNVHWLLWNVQRIDDFAGEPGLMAIGQDVTDRKQAEAKLLQAERLAAIGKAMSGLAHESRNALQRAQATLEVLALLVEDQADALNLVRRIQLAQNDLYRLYEEVRQYSAPVCLKREPHDLCEIVLEAWDLLAQPRSGRMVDLHLRVRHQPSVGGPQDERIDCYVDRFQLIQVLRNILENSLAATPDPVRIDVDVDETEFKGRPAAAIRVRDNGPGIPRENLGSIFEEFFTTKTRGTGLGLAIVKRIVEAHGGDVRVVPEVRPGAEILVTIPLRD